MNGKRHTPEQIIQRMRRAEIEISKRAPGRQGVPNTICAYTNVVADSRRSGRRHTRAGEDV